MSLFFPPQVEGSCPNWRWHCVDVSRKVPFLFELAALSYLQASIFHSLRTRKIKPCVHMIKFLSDWEGPSITIALVC